MRFEGYEDDLPDEEAMIDDVLGENPRARELRLLRTALQDREERLRRDLAAAETEGERAVLKARIAEAARQVMVLRDEESITSFVEDSVRVTLHKPSAQEYDEE